MTITTTHHKAEVHSIPIYVVPPDVLGGLNLPESPAGLTDVVLSQARNHINQISANFPNNPKAIIVIGNQVATFVDGHLRPHDHHDAMRKSIIGLWTESDVIEWQADQPFVIVSVEKASNPFENADGPFKNASAPDNPFHAGPPYISDAHHKARSSIAKAETQRQQYKIRIQIAGRLVDPDFVCGDPPPNP